MNEGLGATILDEDFIYIITCDGPTGRSLAERRDPLSPRPFIPEYIEGGAMGARVRFTGERGEHVPNLYRVEFIDRPLFPTWVTPGNLAQLYGTL